MVINATQRVRDLAVALPSATRIFEQIGIDYCCGGAKSLQEACASAGVSTEETMQLLERAEQSQADGGQFRDWKAATLSELISYIINKHHVFTREELGRIEKLLAKVCDVHGQNHPELLQIRSLFRELKLDLFAHMQKEEGVLFPFIVQMEGAAGDKKPLPRPFFGTVNNPIRTMMTEHDRAGELLSGIRKASSGFTVPEETCATYGVLYGALQSLEQDLHQHIHLENNILFPRAAEMERAR